MTIDAAADLLREALMTVAVLAGPIVLVAFLTSFVVNLLQAMTQLHDTTLTHVPRIVVGGFAILWILPWLLDRLSDYSTGLYSAGFGI